MICCCYLFIPAFLFHLLLISCVKKTLFPAEAAADESEPHVSERQRLRVREERQDGDSVPKGKYQSDTWTGSAWFWTGSGLALPGSGWVLDRFCLVLVGFVCCSGGSDSETF